MKRPGRSDFQRCLEWRWLIFGMAAGWFLAAAASAFGAEWPQFRGPTHNGVSAEKILINWPSEGPRRVWKKALTDGFSSFAISQGKAYTLVKRSIGGQNKEVCVAWQADTGQELWSRPIGEARYDTGGDEGATGNRGGDGPRSTPTVRGSYVFVLSAYLVLECLDAATGQVIWSKDLRVEYGGRVISWQNAASPLIDGDLIFVNGNGSGQTLLALRTTDGSLVWKGHNDKMTQATPVAATILGVRQIIFFAQSGLVSVAPQTGAVLWRYTFRYSTATGASPVVAGDIVYCSAGYGVGAGAVRITKAGDTFTATQIWRKPNELMNHWSTPVHHEGYLYGLYGHGEYGSAPLKCVELATGTEMWSEPGFGPGGALVVDGHILVLNDHGELVLVKADPSAYTEVARYQALRQSWNAPAISDGRIYARSTKEGVCLDVSVQPLAPLRLQSALRKSDGCFQLGIGNSDGSALESGRAAKLEILATTDFKISLTNWTRLTSPGALSNGLWWVDDPASSNLPQRFFIVIENP